MVAMRTGFCKDASPVTLDRSIFSAFTADLRSFEFDNGPLQHRPVALIAARQAAGSAAYRAAAELLPEVELERADRIMADGARHQYVLARALLRCLLGERLAVEPHDVDLDATARGKPQLGRRHAASGLHFNVSHCQDVVLAGFCRGGKIGVDVEGLRTVEHADAIAQRFFSDVEHTAYRALDAADRDLGFLQCWTRKEAYIKAVGDGLYLPLDSFDVTLSPYEEARLIRVPTSEISTWHMLSFRPFSDCIAAAVVGIDADQNTV